MTARAARCATGRGVRAAAVEVASALFALAGPTDARAQESGGAEALVALVRERVAAIQRARLDSSRVEYTSPGGSGQVIRFRDAGQLRKLVVTFDGDGASWRLEHFYWAESLIFAFLRWERFPETGPSRVSELRWYVAGGQVVRGAELGEDGRRRTLRPGDVGFARNAPGVLSTAACWRRYAEAGVEGETTC